jgi:hypothetical protein
VTDRTFSGAAFERGNTDDRHANDPREFVRWGLISARRLTFNDPVRAMSPGPAVACPLTVNAVAGAGGLSLWRSSETWRSGTAPSSRRCHRLATRALALLGSRAYRCRWALGRGAARADHGDCFWASMQAFRSLNASLMTFSRRDIATGPGVRSSIHWS